MIIKARNNLHIPIRLTLTNSRGGKEGNILITVGEQGATLKDFYRVCIDTELLPNREWEDVGNLDIKNEYRVSICGKDISTQ